MCGRFDFSVSDSEELRQILASVQRSCGPSGRELKFPCGEVLPGDHAAVMIADGGRIVGDWQKWGMPGRDGKLVINARAETAPERPMFQRGFAECRCVIPTTGFYEYDSSRRKYFFGSPGKPLYLAGLSDEMDGVNRFVILTTAPNRSMADIHDRMPLVLQREQIRPWLTQPEAAAKLLKMAPPLLDRKCLEAQMTLEGF